MQLVPGLNGYKDVEEKLPFKEGKGEMIILNCDGNLKNYTLKDLILMRDSLTRLINIAEEKNSTGKSRYDIIRED